MGSQIYPRGWLSLETYLETPSKTQERQATFLLQLWYGVDYKSGLAELPDVYKQILVT